jgi:hypothetical protein
MDVVPPYAATAAASEYRLPNDYQAHLIEDEDSTLMRPRAFTNPHAASTLENHRNALGPSLTAPPILFPSEPPPDYAPVDVLASSFRLDAPLIYATQTSNTPRYQLLQEFTRSGKPRKLSIRRLLPTETRCASLPSAPLPPVKTLQYDEDGTMYTITSYGMKGHRSSTLAGSIQLESGKRLLGGQRTKIWLHTKNARRSCLNPENEARLIKYGYHTDDEWDKRLLFSVKRGVWMDGDGRKVAIEEDNRAQFEVLGRVDRKQRDLLVSCWIMRAWMMWEIRWEGDRTGRATVRMGNASQSTTLHGR